jgi:hypothetical protein
MAALEVEVELKKEQSRTGQFSTKALIAVIILNLKKEYIWEND